MLLKEHYLIIFIIKMVLMKQKLFIFSFQLVNILFLHVSFNAHFNYLLFLIGF